MYISISGKTRFKDIHLHAIGRMEAAAGVFHLSVAVVDELFIIEVVDAFDFLCEIKGHRQSRQAMKLQTKSIAFIRC